MAIFKKYDIIIIGGGHAGCEAARSSALLGSKVLMITMNIQMLAQMSCNPSIGGIAKGQIVREIDALGGMTGIITDKTTLQFRMLNLSKGPAMWSPRAQCDRMKFSEEWRYELESVRNIDFWQDEVIEIICRDRKAVGVKTRLGLLVLASSVIICGGTFLNGTIHIGEKSFKGGRIGEKSSEGITESLLAHGIETARMKTGTPVRIDGRSVDFAVLEEQKGDMYNTRFSFKSIASSLNSRSCFIAYTNEGVHQILREGFGSSPLFTGRIKGIGPRYCPSIEDKIERFSHRDRHQLFLEPEGEKSAEYYLNGFSSSLPEEIQYRALLKIPGFENVKILRPGYAIEYDYFPPSQLLPTLESAVIENLFFAGQVNGTTGYEEAAAQGLMAGINAHRKIHSLSAFILKRSEAYIGVLIDDLISKSVDEPYRMFTSRAEYRIMLRQDNADLRLTEIGYKLGLADVDSLNSMIRKRTSTEEIIQFAQTEKMDPDRINPYLEKTGTEKISQKISLYKLILRPQVSFWDLVCFIPEFMNRLQDSALLNKIYIQAAETEIKYKSYIEKESEIADKIGKLENILIPPDINYADIHSISAEAREKLTKKRPATIGQASRISGVSPADISVLIVHIGR